MAHATASALIHARAPTAVASASEDSSNLMRFVASRSLHREPFQRQTSGRSDSNSLLPQHSRAHHTRLDPPRHRALSPFVRQPVTASRSVVVVLVIIIVVIVVIRPDGLATAVVVHLAGKAQQREEDVRQ